MITQRVLIVDDEEDICRSVTKILSRKGFSVDTALSADDALRLLRKGSFDLVITDLMMPRTDGMELLGIIRDHYPELNVIMITGYASIDSAVRAVKLGAAGYLPKPFTPDELMDATVKALGRQGGPRREAPSSPAGAGPASGTLLDVDLPFDAGEVARATSVAYAGALTRSDIPLAGRMKVAEPLAAPDAAKHTRRDRAGSPAHSHSREPIDADLPFPEADVERATDADYVASLDRSDLPRAALYGKGSQARHNVLVVDDEPVVCHSVRRILAKQGCAVEAAFDVDAVMQMLGLNEYDLILLDLKMPKRSGLEVLQSIRRQYPDVPVVMISGYGSIDDAVTAARLGAAEFLQKPFTPEELIHVAEGILAS